MSKNKQLIKAAKDAKPYDGFVREAVNEYAAKQKDFTPGDVVNIVVESLKENCPYNFFGCTDEEGKHLAFGLENTIEALGIEAPTCEDICSHGCCAYINKFLFGIGKKVYGDEAKA